MTPIARDTLKIHNEFMLIITGLFVVVFAIMIYLMIKHRKRSGHAPAKFTGPTAPCSGSGRSFRLPSCSSSISVIMGHSGLHAVIDMEDTKTKSDMVLKVTGMQWKWQ